VSLRRNSPTPSAAIAQAVPAQKMVAGPMPTLAPSLRGTEIDCPLQVDKKGQLVLTIGIRNCFDYFLSSLGEKTEPQLITDIRQYLTTTLPGTALPYALKLLDQYIAYRHGQIQPSTQAKTQTPDGLQAIILAQKSLRLKFFTPIEAEVFFGNEEAYDQYNINVMKINADSSLTEDQKAAKIADLLNQMPTSLADSMRPLMQFAELQQLTKQIQARGGSADELHTMRESLVGPEAAGRLDQLDVESAGWQKQVNGYLAARAQILKAGGDAVNQQQAITTLREQTFSSPQDRLRAQTYETMRDQGDNRVF
jgi:lipase chaperone LimK